jgi:hypothetical protein
VKTALVLQRHEAQAPHSERDTLLFQDPIARILAVLGEIYASNEHRGTRLFAVGCGVALLLASLVLWLFAAGAFD